MTDFQSKKGEIEIPRGSGVEGFVLTVRQILSLPRVQYLHAENGKIVFSRFVRPDEPALPTPIDFSPLLPSFIIRNAQMEELPEQINAALGICALTRAAEIRQLHPIALASGMKSNFWAWHKKTTGVDLESFRESVYGLPFLRDEMLPSEALFLLTSYTSTASIVDTRVVFKLSMPIISEVSQ